MCKVEGARFASRPSKVKQGKTCLAGNAERNIRVSLAFVEGKIKMRDEPASEIAGLRIGRFFRDCDDGVEGMINIAFILDGEDHNLIDRWPNAFKIAAGLNEALQMAECNRPRGKFSGGTQEPAAGDCFCVCHIQTPNSAPSGDNHCQALESAIASACERDVADSAVIASREWRAIINRARNVGVDELERAVYTDPSRGNGIRIRCLSLISQGQLSGCSGHFDGSSDNFLCITAWVRKRSATLSCGRIPLRK